MGKFFIDNYVFNQNKTYPIIYITLRKGDVFIRTYGFTGLIGNPVKVTLDVFKAVYLHRHAAKNVTLP